MQYALSNGAIRVQAERGVNAVCPLCKGAVIAKCGKIKIHHWAHETKDCDSWSEPETEWHRSWKRWMQKDQTEVTRAGHRADIVRANNQVVELQHSSISVEEIQERERAYGAMAWLFDGTAIDGNRLSVGKANDKNYYTFRWKQPKRTISYCKGQVFLDLEGMILQIKKFYFDDGPPYGGWGYLYPKDHFVNWLVGASSTVPICHHSKISDWLIERNEEAMRLDGYIKNNNGNWHRRS